MTASLILLNWRRPDPSIVTRWRGAGGNTAVSALNHPASPLAAIIGPPGAVLGGVTAIMFPQGSGAFEAETSVAAAGVTPGARVLMSLAPTADADENSAELLDPVCLTGRAMPGAITVFVKFAAPVSGPVILNWSVF